jgi:phasin family protein
VQQITCPHPIKDNAMLKIDQFTAANEAAINQLSYFAQLSLANAERFAELTLAASRDAVEQATAHVQSLAGAKDVHEVIALNSAALEPVMKRAYAYSRTAYETTAETNAEVKRAIEKQAAEFKRHRRRARRGAEVRARGLRDRRG